MAQLLFSDVCKLLDVLYDQALEGKSKESQSTIWRWFSHHRHLLDPLDAPAGAALLSTLLPAKRTDRVYHLQDSRLEKIFERAQRLGDSRLRDLRRYKVPGSGLDLADCIYAILSATVRALKSHVSRSQKKNSIMGPFFPLFSCLAWPLGVFFFLSRPPLPLFIG